MISADFRIFYIPPFKNGRGGLQLTQDGIVDNNIKPFRITKYINQDLLWGRI